jgi:hypothetical protein
VTALVPCTTTAGTSTSTGTGLVLASTGNFAVAGARNTVIAE